MPRRTDAFRGLAHASRFQVLSVVRDHPGASLSEISERTGLHPNTLRDHARVLVDEGLIRTEVEHRPSRGRPRNVYFPVDAATENEVAQHRVDEAKRHGDLLRQITPIDTGGLDAESLHQLDALYEHLDDVGLQPEMDEGSMSIDIRPCQFHAIIQDYKEVVCRVHEGLIRDVLDRAGGPIAMDRLLPLITPHTCRLELQVRSAE